MLLPERLLSVDERQCRTALCVDPTAWYATAEGAMPAWMGLELMAQTAAAHNGWQHRESPEPRGGVLLGTRRYSAARADFPAGTQLEAVAELDMAGVFGQSTFQCCLLVEGVPVAEALLRVLETP